MKMASINLPSSLLSFAGNYHFRHHLPHFIILSEFGRGAAASAVIFRTHHQNRHPDWKPQLPTIRRLPTPPISDNRRRRPKVDRLMINRCRNQIVKVCNETK